MTKSLSPEAQAVMGMTAETVGEDLLSALVTEIKLLPKPWQALSEAKPDPDQRDIEDGIDDGESESRDLVVAD